MAGDPWRSRPFSWLLVLVVGFPSKSLKVELFAGDLRAAQSCSSFKATPKQSTPTKFPPNRRNPRLVAFR